MRLTILAFFLLLPPVLASLPLAAGEATTAAAAPEAQQPRLCKYPQDRKAAFSFSFDDGYKEHHTVAAPLLEKYGFRGTFFIIPGIVGVNKPDNNRGSYVRIEWSEVQDLHKRGHEIANHTLFHVGFRDTNLEGWEAEVLSAQKILEEKTGFRPLTFCFPGNGRNPETLAVVMKTHLAARLHCIGYGGGKCTVATMNENIDKLIASGEDNVGMIHAVVPGRGYEPFSDVALFEEHLRYVQSKSDVLWVDTFANVTKYNQNRERCTLSAATPGANAELRFTLTPQEGLTVFPDQPLTIALPATVTGQATAFANGQALPITRRAGRAYLEIPPQKTEVLIRL